MVAATSVLPLFDRNQLASVHGSVQDPVASVEGDLEHGLVERFGTDQGFADEVPALLRAHLATLGEPHGDNLTMIKGAHAGEQKVSFLLKVRVSAAKEHSLIVA